MNAPVAPATPKYAAYICSGCGIGDAIKVPQLVNIAKKEGKMAIIKSHHFLCNAEGVQTIRDDIANEQVPHVCIAACSRTACTMAAARFSSSNVIFMAPVRGAGSMPLPSRFHGGTVSLRQCSWGSGVPAGLCQVARCAPRQCAG